LFAWIKHSCEMPLMYRYFYWAFHNLMMLILMLFQITS
jgi:hypothetical protein